MEMNIDETAIQWRHDIDCWFIHTQMHTREEKRIHVENWEFIFISSFRLTHQA